MHAAKRLPALLAPSEAARLVATADVLCEGTSKPTSIRGSNQTGCLAVVEPVVPLAPPRRRIRPTLPCLRSPRPAVLELLVVDEVPVRLPVELELVAPPADVTLP